MKPMEIKTRQDIFNAMVNNVSVCHNGMTFKIQSIEMEDGSGYSFNLRIVRNKTNIAQMYYIRVKS
jgi:hypothetical protein